MNLNRNDIKLTTLKNEFFYDGNNVTAKLLATLKIPDVLYDIFGDFPIVVKATAKCHEDDKYDKKTGERIALARAESKAYRLLSNELQRRWDYVLEAIETLNPVRIAFIEKANNCVEHNTRYCKELVKDSE